MAIADLSSVLKIFGETSLSAEEQKKLYGEVLMMVLARAASSDSNVHPVEIRTIQRIVQRETGEEVKESDIRLAARPELYETVPMRKYLRSVQRRLNADDRLKVVQSLAEVIKSDTEISVLEVDFFNRVSDALRITPAELAGLQS